MTRGARCLVDIPGLKCQSVSKWRALRLEEGFDSRQWPGIGGALFLCAINAYKHELLRDIIRQEDVAWGPNTHGWCPCALAVAFIMARCNREREGLGQRQTDTDQNTHAD
jgi:hypothetical protein